MSEKLQFCEFEIETRAEGDKLSLVASTGTRDRHGTIIDPRGWDLRAFKANPIVIVDHRNEVEAIVGNADVRVENGRLVAEVSWADTSRAREVRSLYESGVARAISTGFIPKDVEVLPDGTVLIRSAELAELSLVAVGSNREALSLRAVPREGKETNMDPQKVEALEARAATLEARLAAVEEKNVELERRALEVQVVKPDVERVKRGFELVLKGAARRHDGLLEKGARMLGFESRIALQEDANAEGGYAVPTALLGQLLVVPGEAGIVRRLGRVVPMTTKTATAARLDSKPTAAIVAEEGSFPEAMGSDPIGALSLVSKKIGAQIPCSTELVQDEAVGLIDTLLAEAALAIRDVEDQEGLEGDGTNFTGVQAAANVQSEALSGTLTNLDKFIALKRKIYAISPTAAENGSWVISPQTWEQLTTLKVAAYSGDTNGAYRFEVGANSLERRIDGNRVFVSNQIVENGGVGTNETTAYFIPPGAIIIGDRQMFSVLVDPYSLSSNGKVKFIFSTRGAIAVALPTVCGKLTAIELS